MNFNTVLFLANPDCRAIKAIWSPRDENGKGPDGKPVHDEWFKTTDATIKVGDLVLGETDSRFNLCVFEVVAVDVEVDLERSPYVRWIVGKVGDAKDNLKALKARENAVIDAIRAKDKEKKRAELAATMLKDYGEELRNLGLQVPSAPAAPAISAAPPIDP